MGRGYNWFCVVIAGFGMTLYGIDNVVIASTFAQPGFLKQFAPSATMQGAIATAFFGGDLLGILSVGYLADAISRKRTLQVGAFIGLIGAILQVASQKISTFLVGRVIAGIASGIMITAVQIYQAEIAPPHLRGSMINVQITTINCAALFILFVGYGTYHSKNLDFAWRFPIALQLLPAIVLLIGGFFIPYSPRWLVMKERHEEARTVLKRLHDDNEDHTFWEKEYTVLVAQLQAEKAERAGVTVLGIFTNRQDLFRIFLATVALTCNQTTGAGVIQVFQTVIYANLGFGTTKVLLYVCIFQILVIVGALLNLSAIDRFGRRPLFITGLISISIVLALFTAFAAKFQLTGASGWGKAGIAMVMLFGFVYATTFVATGFVYAAEILPTRIRGIGMSFGMFWAFAMVCMFSQVTPIALGDIGYKYPPVFIACNLFWLPIVWWFFKETKGLNLEEINTVFGGTVSKRIEEVTEAEAHEKVANTTTMEDIEMT